MYYPKFNKIYFIMNLIISRYHLKDVIVGKIYFLLVRIKIKHMEIAIIKKETTGSGPNTFTENVTIAKYEIMDGAPVRGKLAFQDKFAKLSLFLMVLFHTGFTIFRLFNTQIISATT